MKNTYWSGNGAEQSKYNEMINAGFTFSKKAYDEFRSYYRYYNDGDIPAWAKRDKTMTKPYIANCRFVRELSDAGMQVLEDRVTKVINAAYKRFSKEA